MFTTTRLFLGSNKTTLLGLLENKPSKNKQTFEKGKQTNFPTWKRKHHLKMFFDIFVQEAQLSSFVDLAEIFFSYHWPSWERVGPDLLQRRAMNHSLQPGTRRAVCFCGCCPKDVQGFKGIQDMYTWELTNT